MTDSAHVDSPLVFGRGSDRVSLTSRLIVGTGKYKDLDDTETCMRRSGSGMVTVAIRRVPQTAPGERSLSKICICSNHYNHFL